MMDVRRWIVLGILLSVNGWNGNTGQWVLNITGP